MNINYLFSSEAKKEKLIKNVKEISIQSLKNILIRVSMLLISLLY
jgi:hypothetical protein